MELSSTTGLVGVAAIATATAIVALLLVRSLRRERRHWESTASIHKNTARSAQLLAEKQRSSLAAMNNDLDEASARLTKANAELDKIRTAIETTLGGDALAELWNDSR